MNGLTRQPQHLRYLRYPHEVIHGDKLADSLPSFDDRQNVSHTFYDRQICLGQCGHTAEARSATDYRRLT